MHLAYLLVVSISGSCYIFFVNSRRFYLNTCCELKQRFLHVWHGTDQTIIDNAIYVAWTSSLCADKRQTLQSTIVTIFSDMTTDVAVFLKCESIIRLFFFWKLPQIWTSNFLKVVQQYTEGMVGSIIPVWVLLEIYLSFQHWKNFENPLRTDKVIAMSSVYYFFWETVYNFIHLKRKKRYCSMFTI